MNKRDEFILAIIRWTQHNRWKGMGYAGWPSFDDAGGENGFIESAFSVPENVIPDLIDLAVKQFIEYGLKANTLRWSDEDRKRIRPEWLPIDWEWKFR